MSVSIPEEGWPGQFPNFLFFSLLFTCFCEQLMKKWEYCSHNLCLKNPVENFRQPNDRKESKKIYNGNDHQWLLTSHTERARNYVPADGSVHLYLWSLLSRKKIKPKYDQVFRSNCQFTGIYWPELHLKRHREAVSKIQTTGHSIAQVANTRPGTLFLPKGSTKLLLNC